MTPLAEWGNVWGTSVTVPVTISTSYVPQTKVWEHIGFTLFLIIIIIILSSAPVCPGVFLETTQGTKMKPF